MSSNFFEELHTRFGKPDVSMRREGDHTIILCRQNHLHDSLKAAILCNQIPVPDWVSERVEPVADLQEALNRAIYLGKTK